MNQHLVYNEEIKSFDLQKLTESAPSFSSKQIHLV